ncbi:hypothetical protein CQW23_35537 [Capsicum baccatum]|uniref:Uncharacterized protein n=1 Tax=Capsicum baccatum TaxID=33114 RepID=A0A2G2UVM2_CAPBA|nr:hypothetical protein CQW23_35537 [Capsicum baccatum]
MNSHSVPFSSDILHLVWEFGDLLVSCGLIGEAVKVYEDLELWDNLIYCYRLMEKKASAVELIQARLSERPSDHRLWYTEMKLYLPFIMVTAFTVSNFEFPRAL